MPTHREVSGWADEIDAVSCLIGSRFSRRDLRAHAESYLRGLISRVERKNGWQLAEEAGEQTPTNLQHFISRSKWGVGEVRDDLQRYVMQHLGSPDGVLIVDETGFLKKGTKSVGVKRQYSGTAGRIENSQVGVFLAYRSAAGHALIDRSLYLPKEWAEDSDRRIEAKVPESVSFATKPELARQMLRRTLDAGVPAKWVTADEVYGSDYKFRRFCEDRGLHYVVAISKQTRLFLNGQRKRVDEHTGEMKSRNWRRLSCGPGLKGERLYDWAFVSLSVSKGPGSKGDDFTHGFLVRRSISDPDDLAYFFTKAPRRTHLKTLVRIAGSRWAIEECFEQAKQETGLDEYEVRSWIGWHRHITLSMLAHATLAVIRSRVHSTASKKTTST
ncbi:MAG: IS701 family transposase [Planctomycetaceae bacterium]|nr:IS701 family transposase [Planctomycetaceae bacterium]